MTAENEENPRAIAKERIELLFNFARKAVEKNPKRAKQYVSLAKKIGAKYTVRLGAAKQLFCRNCLLPLIPGKTAKVRIARGARKLTICLSCNSVSSRKIGRAES
jgi:ribonuclease P protein subunit RPR2